MTFDLYRMAAFTSAAAAGGGYDSFGTIIYEARDAGGIAIPFDTSIAMVPTGTIAMVFEMDNAAQTDFFAGSGASSSTVAGISIFNLTSGALRSRVTDGTLEVLTNTSGGAILSNTAVAVMCKWTAAGNHVVRAGGAQASNTMAALGSLGSGSFFGGSTNNGAGAAHTNGLVGTCYHLIIFSTAVDNLADLETALNADWGL